MQAIKFFLMNMNIKVNFLWFILLVGYEAKAQDNLDIFQEKKIILDTAVRYGKLDNGFTYYLRRHDNPKRTVEFQLVVKGGFFHENDDQVEYSHLMEHLGAGRTKNFPNLKNHLREVGGYNNAMTQNSHTFYWARLPSGEKEIQTGLKVIRDWAQNLDFPQKVIDVERGAVLGELRTTDAYSTWLNKIVENKVLKTTGQTGYDSKKIKSSIEQFDRKAFLDFYEDWYRPDLEAAIIVGDINIDSMELKVKKIFSDLRMPKRRKNGEARVDAQRIELSGEKTFQIILDTVNPKIRMEIISKHLNKKSFGLKTRSDFKKWLMQELYKEMVESRSRMLEEQFDPPFSEFRLSFDGGGFGKKKVINGIRMTIDFGTEDKQEIKKKFIQAIVAWKQIHTNFSISELQKAKEQVQNRYVGKAITSHDLAKEYRHHFVQGNAALAPEVKERLIMSVLDEIELQGIQNVILEYGNLDKNTDFLVFKGKRGDVPKFKVFKQWLKEVKKKEVRWSIRPSELLKSLSDVIQFPLGANEPIKSKTNNLIGVTTVTLQNGIKILFKPSDPASPRHKGFVTIDAFRLNEIPISNRKEFLAATMVPNYMEFSGAGSLTKFDIERFIREKGIRLKFFADAKYQRIYAMSKEKDIKELLNLLYLYVDQPRKDPEGFAALKDDYEQTLKGFVTHSGLRFLIDDKVEFARYPEIPVLGLSDLEKLNLDDVFAAYNGWFSDLSGYTFIITGDFKTEQILPIVNEKLSVFPVSTRKAGPIGTPKIPLKRINEVMRLKNINQAFVRLYFPVSASRDVKTQIELELLTKALYERVWNRLRKGTYAPTTGGEWIDFRNGIFAFRMNFDSELGNEENMIRAATEEFRKLRDNGVNQSWLDAAISDKTLNSGRDLHTFGTFNFWRDYLKEKLISYENLEQEVLQYSTVLEHFTTLEDLNAAAKKYLSEENLQQFIFVPEYYNPEAEDRFN